MRSDNGFIPTCDGMIGSTSHWSTRTTVIRSSSRRLSIKHISHCDLGENMSMNPEIDQRGNKRWYNDLDLLHRTDGPAVIRVDGYQSYWINGQYHRTDGPAIINSDGYQAYWINDIRHRLDGPAVINPDGTMEYWIYGNLLTEEEFNDIIQSEEHLNWYLLQIL